MVSVVRRGIEGGRDPQAISVGDKGLLCSPGSKWKKDKRQTKEGNGRGKNRKKQNHAQRPSTSQRKPERAWGRGTETKIMTKRDPRKAVEKLTKRHLNGAQLFSLTSAVLIQAASATPPGRHCPRSGHLRPDCVPEAPRKDPTKQLQPLAIPRSLEPPAGQAGLYLPSESYFSTRWS